MADNTPWYAKMENLAVREMFRDKWLQVKAFFTPSDYTREMFSTVTRGWVAWQAFLIVIFWTNAVFYLASSDWMLAWYSFLIGVLFGLVAFYQLMHNMARKIIDALTMLAHDQQKTMYRMLDDMEMITGVTPRNSEEFD